MFIYKNPFPFPRIVGVVDDGNEFYRSRAAFRNTIRIITEPSVLTLHPIHPKQATIGVITQDTLLMWTLISSTFEGPKLSFVIAENPEAVPKNIANSVIPIKVIYEASKQIPQIEISQLDAIIRVSYLLNISHLVLPSGLSSGDYEQAYVNIVSPDDEEAMNDVLPEIVWITTALKNKNYEDRKQIIQNLSAMLQAPKETSMVDRFVLFGSSEYLTQSRFPEKEIPVTYNVVKSQPTVYSMFDWAFTHLRKGSVVICVRQETSISSFTMIESAMRIENHSIGAILPFSIPDVPDPKPELFKAGDIRCTCGYVFKVDPAICIPKESGLSQCNLFSANHHEIVMSEMMKLHYRIGNATRQLGVLFPLLKSFILEKSSFIPRFAVQCPEMPCISYFDTRYEFPGKAQATIALPEVSIHSILEGEGPLERKTLFNMINKMLCRQNIPSHCIFQEKESVLPKLELKLYSGNSARFRRNAWVVNKEMVSQDYWGTGLQQRETGFVHQSKIVDDCVIIGGGEYEKNTLTHYGSLINRLSSFLVLSANNSKLVMDCEQEEQGLFQQIGKPVEIVNLSKCHLFGNAQTQFVQYPKAMKPLHFVPHIVKIANQEYHKGLNVDLAMMRMLGEVNGMIVGSKWTDVVLESVKILHPEIRWKIVEDYSKIVPEEFANSLYVIGSQEGGGWIGTMFTNPTMCKIVEIAPEYDGNISWFLLTEGIGCKHQILPLKQEPKNRCVQRIKGHLSSYM